MYKILTATVLLTLCFTAAAAEIHMVWPDGIGPYENIQAAIDASAQNDTIMLIEGYFSGPGNRDLQIPGSRTFIGFGEPGSNVIDAEGEPLGVMVDNDDPYDDIIFKGITFANGSRFTANSDYIYFERCHFENCERVIRVWGYTSGMGSVDLVDCVVENCRGGTLISANSIDLLRCDFIGNETEPGSGLKLAESYRITAEDCRFDGNNDLGYNSALLHNWGSDTTEGQGYFRNCLFTGNAVSYCVAINASNALFEDCRFESNLAHCIDLIDTGSSDLSIEVRGCLFTGNGGAGILCYNMPLDVDNCTFVFGGGAGDIVDSSNQWSPPMNITRSIFAFRMDGPAILQLDLPPTLMVQCTDIFGIADGEWIGLLAPYAGLNGNFSADPLFCDWQAGDLTLYDTSPCLPGGNECGVQIGAFGQGCLDLTAVDAAPGSTQRLVAHPNPFNPEVRLSFSLEAAGPVHLSIFDLAGRRVATLLSGELRNAGAQSIDWRAESLPSGVYLAQLVTDSKQWSRKLVLVE